MSKIKILLVGYGKMGRMVEENVSSINGEIVKIYDPKIPEFNINLQEIDFSEISVAIEFSHPDSGFENVKNLLRSNIPVVSGTTGWFHRIDELKKEFNANTHTLIYGANFSIGMNLFYQIVELSSRLINQVNLYDVYGLESHHRKKADSPSGTARVLSEIIMNNIDSKDNAIYDLNNKAIDNNDFTFTSVRAGSIVGYHELGFDAEFDEIKLIHNAKNRKGFALGALYAARYAINNKGFLNFKEIFQQVISNDS